MTTPFDPEDPFAPPPYFEPLEEPTQRVRSRAQMLFSFEGRIRRADYWGYSVLVWLAWASLVFLVPVLPGRGGMWMVVPAWLAVTWVFAALGVKRLHDRNRPAWWLLLNLVPLLNVWLAIEVGFMAGTPGTNSYGPDPRSAG